MRYVPVGLIVLLLFAAAGTAGFYRFLHPSQEAPPRSWPAADAPPADERSAYYRQEEGEVRLALPGVYGGFVLYHTEDLGSASYAPAGEPAGEKREPGGAAKGNISFTANGYVLRRPEGETVRARRFHPQPFSVQDVAAEQAGIALSGWLFIPRRSRGAGVVIVHGSGDSHRNNAWYVKLAARLAQAGAVVLLPDKRGSGRSGGHWWHADFHQLAGDAAAWLRVLRQKAPGLSRYGYAGVSQGGRIAPLAAARHGKTDFIAILSTSAVTQNRQLRHEITADARARGLPDWLARLIAPVFAERVRNRRPDWWRAVGDTDPIAEWRAAGVPLFIAYGREDENDNVPVAASVARIRAGLGTGSKVRLHIYEEVGHGYIVEGKRIILPRFLADLAAWLGLDAEAASVPFAAEP